MTKLLALSGKKQSGKNTAANFLYGCCMASRPTPEEPLTEYAQIDELGRLIVPALVNEEIIPVIFPTESDQPQYHIYLSQNVWPYIKTYSFADILKQLCINLLGLSREQCYGNNKEKDEKTDLIWRNMPGLPKGKTNADTRNTLRKLGFDIPDNWSATHHMSGRHVLQYVGTDIFRKMVPNVWVNSCIGQVRKDSPELAVITDCRFPNEVEGVQLAGGKVVRFTRAPHAGQDEHASETALDPDNYDWESFDAILDNVEDNIEQQNEKFYDLLTGWGYINFENIATYLAPATA